MKNDYDELYLNELNQNIQFPHCAVAYSNSIEKNKELARVKKQKDDYKQNLLDKQHQELVEQNIKQIDLLTNNNIELIKQNEELKKEKIERDKKHKQDSLTSWISLGIAFASLIVATIALMI